MNGSLLRLLDANANRAREALRVVEDYARFVLGIESISSQIKQLRHDLADATRGFVGEAILHRDTAGDVGTTTKTESELSRDDLSHVVVAAGKRLGEALRAMEEFAKVDHPAASRALEAIRYRFYDLETTIARTLRPANRLREVRLCVLITESLCKLPWMQVVEQAIEGGADCLQLREKDLEGGEFLRRAIAFVEACRRRGVISIINDRPDIAMLCGADGVHLGQDDLPAVEARKLLGNDKIIGVSTHHLDQARQAVLDSADYIGVGPVFPSNTKPRPILPGLEYAREVATQIPLPAMAIAGITLDNAQQVAQTGIQAIAVSSAVIASDDPAAAARSLRATMVEQGSQGSSVGQTFLSASSGQECPDETGIIRKTRRRLPDWHMPGSTCYLTFRTLSTELSPQERLLTLQHIVEGHQRFYDLYAVVIMPDHVQMLLDPRAPYDLPQILKGIKGVSSKLINTSRGSHGTIWQDESYERIIREHREFEEKLQYIVNNAAEAGIVADPWDYEALWVKEP